MIWIDKTSNQRILKIESITENELTKDFKNLFTQINGNEFENGPDLLIYIDATNGNLFLSTFNFETNEVHDEKGICVELSEFWEENQNAYDFDDLIISAIKNAYTESYLTNFKSKYVVYYQTEDERKAKRL